MTPKQTQLYWRDFAAWKRAREARGLPAGETERHALTRKALGYHKSSKALTNRELDQVLMAFRAESRPTDLDAQLRLQGQTEARRQALLETCRELAGDLTDYHSARTVVAANSARDRYLGTLSRSVTKKPYEQCSEHELATLRGILSRRIEDIERKAITAGVNNPDEPF